MSWNCCRAHDDSHTEVYGYPTNYTKHEYYTKNETNTHNVHAKPVHNDYASPTSAHSTGYTPSNYTASPSKTTHGFSSHESHEAPKKSTYDTFGHGTSTYSSEVPKKSTYGNFGTGLPSYVTTSQKTPTYTTTSEAPKKATYDTYGYGTSSGYGTTGYGTTGNYGYSSTTSHTYNPTPSTHHAETTYKPSTSNYGTSYGTNYGTSTGTSSYGTTGNYGTSYGTNYGTNNGTSYGGYSYGASTSQPQQQNYSYSQPQQQSSYSYSQPSSSVSTQPSQSYTNVLNQLKSSGQKYRDNEFPPEIRSLTGGLSDYELAQSGNQLDWRSLVWRRAEEIYGKGNFQVFQGKIEPNDIKQGSLGDCYFLSTLASLAENPDRIKRIFESQTPNEQGCYAVRICDAGIWQTVLLDDFLPCDPSSKKPSFTTGNGNEIWVQLLEKAWAKMYGSYARIEAGLTRECLHDLTGAPTKYYLTNHTDKHEEIWHSISHGEKKNYAMTCGSGDFFEGADLMSGIGLVGSHAYSLLAAIEVTDRYGRKVRLVKLRNPWGKGEWTGDWSDKSPLWTEELKRQAGHENKEDGSFFMSFQDMLQYFSDIQICKIHDDYKYKAVKATCDARHAVYFKINIRTPGHYFITLNQESTRKHKESEGYKYSPANLVLGKKTPQGYKYVEGYQRADKEVWTDGHLEAGEYIVYAKVAWNNRRPKDFSISCYGQGEVDIEQVNKSYCNGFIEGVYLDKGRQAKKITSYQDLGVSNCYRAYEFTDDGFAYFYYKNQSNKTLEEEINFQSGEGLKLKKPYRGRSFKMVVPPGQEKVLVAKSDGGVSFTERAKFL